MAYLGLGITTMRSSHKYRFQANDGAILRDLLTVSIVGNDRSVMLVPHVVGRAVLTGTGSDGQRFSLEDDGGGDRHLSVHQSGGVKATFGRAVRWLRMPDDVPTVGSGHLVTVVIPHFQRLEGRPFASRPNPSQRIETFPLFLPEQFGGVGISVFLTPADVPWVMPPSPIEPRVCLAAAIRNGAYRLRFVGYQSPLLKPAEYEIGFSLAFPPFPGAI